MWHTFFLAPIRAGLAVLPTKPAVSSLLVFRWMCVGIVVAVLAPLLTIETVGLPSTERILEDHAGWVHAIVFTPDGSRLITGAGTRGKSGECRLWNLAERNAWTPLGNHSRPIRALSCSPDGRLLAIGYQIDGVRLWDIQAGKEIQDVPVEVGEVCSVAFSPNGNLLAVAGTGSVEVWNLATWERCCKTAGRLAIAFSPDGKTLALAGDWTGVWLCDPVSGKTKSTLDSSGAIVVCLAFSPDGRQLVGGCHDGSILVWDPASACQVGTLTGHAEIVTAIAFSPDGKLLVTGSNDGTARFWNPVSGLEQAILVGHESPINTVAFSPDGKRLATGSYDRTVRLWAVR